LLLRASVGSTLVCQTGVLTSPPGLELYRVRPVKAELDACPYDFERAQRDLERRTSSQSPLRAIPIVSS
jgi:hypothetical protein